MATAVTMSNNLCIVIPHNAAQSINELDSFVVRDGAKHMPTRDVHRDTYALIVAVNDELAMIQASNDCGFIDHVNSPLGVLR